MRTEYRKYRRKLVGWDMNSPEAFPGYGGCVGLLQDCAVMPNGDWLLLFRAGYWHVSMATPYVIPEDLLKRWQANGFPVNHVAPRGGRVMAIRSSDNGQTWSKPYTIIDTPLDDYPISITILRNGMVLLFLGNQASWYGLDEAPEGHLSVNSRVGVICSNDTGYTWSKPLWLDSPYKYYQRAYGDPLVLSNGNILFPTYCMDQKDGQLYGAIHQSEDSGKTWKCISTIEREDGGDIDEPSLAILPSGKIILISDRKSVV